MPLSADMETIRALLERIAAALEGRLAQGAPAPPGAGDAFVWQPEASAFHPVERVNRIPLRLLRGIDGQQDELMENTLRFAGGLPANNALLWGARGTGKSSLVKAVHAEVAAGRGLVLVEIHREDVATLPRLLQGLAGDPRRFILFCDDLAFEAGDSGYKSLKAVLEGGIEGRPDNVLFYATSNRRHLMAREMIENERSTAIAPSEAVEEKVSLSDRFGLWLGFHGIDQDTYLAMVNAYADAIGLAGGRARGELERAALQWSVARGSRSGRVAWQFIVDAAGRAGAAIDLG